MNRKQLDMYFYVFNVIMVIVSFFWFKAKLGEGYNIVYFALFTAVFGFYAGTKFKLKK